MSWNFKREESQGFETKVPEGKHRIRIKSADKAVSKQGNDMLVLQFEISGFKDTIYHYITFMNNDPAMTNRMLTAFFDSFKDIPEGDFNMQNWIGKVGACVIKHEEYNGNTNAKISYFIHAEKQGDLPPWKNADGIATDANGFAQIPDDIAEDLPWE